MMRGLSGKVAIVTGGATGIGRAIMERLCQEGVSVTFSGISGNGEATQRECNAKGYKARFIQGDMAEEAFCRRLVEETQKTWGKVNYLVNNAFSFIAKGSDASREEWLRMMSVGPIGYATMAACVAPPMRAEGGGSIVNLSSISAHIAQPNRWTYNAAKGAVNQLTRCMALDLSAYNIRVNTVSPGWIWTREVEECAAPVAFLLSDEASFITSTEIMVDGGYRGMGSEGLGEASSFAGSS